ncbi:MAG: metallophosphoesterase [Flavobacteriaceae bacterium]
MCTNGLAQGTDSISYKFFVAGHAYGSPHEPHENKGLHPPFKEKLGLIKNDTDILFGILTGDVVYKASLKQEWEELEADLLETGKRIFVAPGNHDVAKKDQRALFTKMFGASYRSFQKGKDLFIILDPNLDKWNISGEQLKWLREKVIPKAEKAKNVFVFFHQLLWWAKDNDYRKYRPNSPSGRAEEINFFTEVFPLFKNLNKPVYMFAGDTGAFKKGIMYHKEGDITFIASGMGGRKEDNFIITTIHKDSKVSFELVALNGDDKAAMGSLEEHALQVKKK